MPMRRFLSSSSLALLAALGLAACGGGAEGGDDIPLGEPAGMGAGRPDTSAAESGVLGEVEPDAEEVLEGMGVGPMAGDSAAAAAGQPADTAR